MWERLQFRAFARGKKALRQRIVVDRVIQGLDVDAGNTIARKCENRDVACVRQIKMYPQRSIGERRLAMPRE